MPPIKLSDREKNLAIITLGVVVFYVFYVFMFAPLWDEIGKLRNRVQKARLDLKVAEEKIKILNVIQEREGMLPEKSDAPREERALEVLRALSHAISDSNLNLILIKPIITENEGFKFELTCAGSYENLYSFLRILRAMRVLVKFDSLNAGGGGGKEPILNIKMVLTAYY